MVVVVGTAGTVAVVVPPDADPPTVNDEPASNSWTVEPLRLASGTKVTAPLNEDANVWAASVPDGP